MGPVLGRGVAPPPAETEDPLVEAIRNLLPTRSAEDRARGEISMIFGHGKESETLLVPVLGLRANRAWQARVKAAGQKLLVDLDEDSTGEVIVSLLTGATDVQVELLEAYQPVMLARDYVERVATEEQVLDGFLGVVAAGYPLPVKLLGTLLANRDIARWLRLQAVRLLYSRSTSSSPPNTDGPPEPQKQT